MQISALKKLLQLISQSESPSEKSSSEEISEAKETEDKLTVSDGDGEVLTAESNTVDKAPENETVVTDTKAHLISSVPRTAKTPLGAITKQELAEIRELFKDMDDTELQRLYKKVTK